MFFAPSLKTGPFSNKNLYVMYARVILRKLENIAKAKSYDSCRVHRKNYDRSLVNLLKGGITGQLFAVITFPGEYGWPNIIR